MHFLYDKEFTFFFWYENELSFCSVARKFMYLRCFNDLIFDVSWLQDPDLGVYCRWCGKCDDLIRCKSCKMLFCAMCIARNFGETRFLDVETNGWDCCCCSPVLLHQFISECEKALKGFMVSSSESESELSDGQMVVRLG